jgi:hypothetical protein
MQRAVDVDVTPAVARDLQAVHGRDLSVLDALTPVQHHRVDVAVLELRSGGEPPPVACREATQASAVSVSATACNRNATPANAQSHTDDGDGRSRKVRDGLHDVPRQLNKGEVEVEPHAGGQRQPKDAIELQSSAQDAAKAHDVRRDPTALEQSQRTALAQRSACSSIIALDAILSRRRDSTASSSVFLLWRCTRSDAAPCLVNMAEHHRSTGSTHVRTSFSNSDCVGPCSPKFSNTLSMMLSG